MTENKKTPQERSREELCLKEVSEQVKQTNDRINLIIWILALPMLSEIIAFFRLVIYKIFMFD